MRTKIFWKNVKKCIKEKGVTQQEAATSCKIPYSTLKNWMTRSINPPLVCAYRISQYLGVSLEFLINGQKKNDISKISEEALSFLKQVENKLVIMHRGVD